MKGFRLGIIFFVLLATALVVYFYFPEESLEEINLVDKKLESPDVKSGSRPESVGKEVLIKKEYPILDIPFIVQAPFGEWDNPIYQDGCEEAVSLMVVSWALNRPLNREIAQDEILAISQYEKYNFGQFTDTSAADTMKRIIQGYFNYNKAEVKNNIILKDIINEIEKGNAVIVPANGQLLNNPYFTPPGPERHNLVIKGYDSETREFITNDPGTKRGESYRYNEQVLFNAIKDYPTGDHLPIEKIEKNMIIVIK